jgi:hypothetical protein
LLYHVEHRAPIHLGVDVKAKFSGPLSRSRKPALLSAAFQHPIGATRELIGDEASNQIDWRNRLSLSLAKARR